MGDRFPIGAATDPGIKRKNKPNQDSIGVVPYDPEDAKNPLLILADGMGGYSGGEVASSLAVSVISSIYQDGLTDPGRIGSLLEECICEAHKAISKRSEENEMLSSMGSTIVLASPGPDSVWVANVGDSRAYLISPNGQIRQISYDHSLVMDQVRAGIITENEAQVHPRRNVLTMSLSGKRSTVTPYVAEIPWQEGDYVLICSDGLWGTVSEAQIGYIVTSLEPQDAAEKLIRMANFNQGPDNISVLIVRNGEKAAESRYSLEDEQKLVRTLTAKNLLMDGTRSVTNFVLSGTRSVKNMFLYGTKSARRWIIIAGIFLFLFLCAMIFILKSFSNVSVPPQPTPTEESAVTISIILEP
ncbi:MAG: serine/threonine-protein phosphatase [Anaerolineaceae bacterium]|nr:serine/threonine-protein phosphatase [Anaerolineaceae bacterium]